MLNNLYEQLPFKQFEIPEWYQSSPSKLKTWKKFMRLIYYDPSEIYERIAEHIDPFKRRQNPIPYSIMFPKNDQNICRCGCGQYAKQSWATPECLGFCFYIHRIIIYGTPAETKRLINIYFGDECVHCTTNRWNAIDHIIPVKHGGGACWLSNFAPLCDGCHKVKTKKDFRWGEFKYAKK